MIKLLLLVCCLFCTENKIFIVVEEEKEWLGYSFVKCKYWIYRFKR